MKYSNIVLYERLIVCALGRIRTDVGKFGLNLRIFREIIANKVNS
jgi:hypothetical protein